MSGSEQSRLSEFVATHMGLHFPPERWEELEQLTRLAAADFDHAEDDQFIPWLLATPLTRAQIEMLATRLTVAETYFWREPRVIEALRDTILPELIRTRAATGRRLRLWSAGCASGEEVYTLAILLHELIPDLEDWHITLLATDINPHMLRQAQAGVYEAWAFRDVPAGFQERHFDATDDGKFQVAAHLRKMVSFAYLNLAEDGYPSPMNNTHTIDILFCRNVLMYFAPEHAQQARLRLFQALAEGGWLVVAGSELSQQNYAQFSSIRFPGAFVYRRDAQPPSAPAGLPRLPVAEAATPVDVVAPAAMPAPAPATADQPSTTAAPEALALAVRRLANQGQLAAARAACEAALAVSKLDPILHYLHASILQELEQPADARAALNRALYLAPDFVVAHFALGNMALRQGEAAAAKRSFANVLELLSGFDSAALLPEADGLTAGRLMSVVRGNMQAGGLTP